MKRRRSGLKGPDRRPLFRVGRWPVALCSTLGLIAVNAWAAPSKTAQPSPTREFSADIVTRDATGAPIDGGAKIYVANGNVRIETPEASAGYFLVNGETGKALFVRPARGVFMDAKRSTRLTQIFIPIDVHHPCPQWLAAAKNAGLPGAFSDWRCELVTASVGSHDAIEYNVTSPDRQSSQRWIDPGLAFPVKLQLTDGTTIALEHIRVEAQPPGLFEVPSDYRKLDPQALIERIKHSDVWAAPPN
jgi:hypothetical protein